VGFEVADRGGKEGPVVYADTSKMIAVITAVGQRHLRRGEARVELCKQVLRLAIGCEEG
jgi:hypothetical protein